MEHAQPSSESGRESSSEMERCADLCFDCYRVCSTTIQACLSKGGNHVEPIHIKVLEDCAKICALSGDFLIRNSELHQHTCRACADICERCANECSQMTDDDLMQQCAETCSRCAESCKSMSAH